MSFLTKIQGIIGVPVGTSVTETFQVGYEKGILKKAYKNPLTQVAARASSGIIKRVSDKSGLNLSNAEIDRIKTIAGVDRIDKFGGAVLTSAVLGGVGAAAAAGGAFAGVAGGAKATFAGITAKAATVKAAAGAISAGGAVLGKLAGLSSGQTSDIPAGANDLRNNTGGAALPLLGLAALILLRK